MPKIEETPAPAGSQARVQGLHYKIGLHGRAYYWSNSQWRLSCIEPHRIAAEINAANTQRKQTMENLERRQNENRLYG